MGGVEPAAQREYVPDADKQGHNDANCVGRRAQSKTSHDRTGRGPTPTWDERIPHMLAQIVVEALKRPPYDGCFSTAKQTESELAAYPLVG
jgi:hypothetical protein